MRTKVLALSFVFLGAVGARRGHEGAKQQEATMLTTNFLV
jgi:hypothetical protein